MRISRLEIFGFKSFVERFVLNFDQKQIGIIGPNGCGKSNVVDALRWVLGETHAKQLRGSTLEDVIFNGSEARRPLGMAEVSITIVPDDAWRQAVAERDSSLIDALENLENAEVANTDEAEVPLVAAEVIAETPATEPTVIEPLDLAGQLNQLASAVPGIFQAAEIQLTRRLYRSGESEYFINRVPCRLRDFSDLFRLIGLGPRGLSIVQQGQVSDIINKKPLERRALLEEAAGISGFRIRMEAAQRKLERTGINLERLSDIIAEVEKQVTSLRSQAKKARLRQSLKDTCRDLEMNFFRHKTAGLLLRQTELANQRETTQAELDFLLNELLAAQAEEETARASIEMSDVELSDLRRNKDTLQAQINAERERAAQVRLEMAETDGELRSSEERLRGLDERRTEVQSELDRRMMSVQNARTTLTSLTAQHSEAARLADTGASSEHLETARNKVFSLRRDLSSREHELNARHVEQASLASEIRTLSAQLDAAKELASRADSGDHAELERDFREILAESSGSGHIQTLLSGLRVPEQYSRAVMAAIGDKLSHLVVDDPEKVLSKLGSLLKERGVSGGVLFARPTVSSSEAALAGAESVLSLISAAPGFHPTVDALLRDTYFVKTTAEGFALLRKAEHIPHLRLVTPEGELITHSGWSRTNAQGAALRIPAEIEERRTRLAQVEHLLDTLAKDKQGLSEQLANGEAELQTIEHEETRRTNSELNRLTAEIASIEGLVNFETRRLTELNNEHGQIEARSLHLQEQRAKLLAHRESLEAQAQAPQADRPSSSSSDSGSNLHDLELRISQLELKRSETRHTLAQVAQTTDELRRRRDDMRADLSSQAIGSERVTVELSMLCDDMRMRLASSEGSGEVALPSTDEALAIAAAAEQDGGGLEATLAALQDEVELARRRLEKAGEVDPEVIEIFEREEARLIEMTTQRDDLERATKTLERTITALKEVSRKRFLETFDFVNRKFMELVPQLFGGGAGYLELLNPEDPLATGVEITVRPPGKKLRSLELMSGGEKALCAAAVLMSMFLYRPSPICVLDEVDAPLDDANLARFLGMIGEISKTTQFLMITHNKQTMAAMDRLIGITMQEKGVSTALSVTMQDAEEELERLVANA